MYIYVLFAIATLLYFSRVLLHRLKERWFAGFMTTIAKQVAQELQPYKDKLFVTLPDVITADPDLKQKEGKHIRILEIGCGSGANLKYFPPGSSLVLVDINPSFEGVLRENLSKFPELTIEKLIHCSAEKINEVPDASADVVVSTTVLCSVEDVDKALKEVHRILVPGGKFYFLEHILDKQGTIRPIIQRVLTALRIWPSIFCGCHLSRDLDRDILNSGFSQVEIEHFTINTDSHMIYYFVKTQIWGVAVK